MPRKNIDDVTDLKDNIVLLVFGYLSILMLNREIYDHIIDPLPASIQYFGVLFAIGLVFYILTD